MENLNAADRLDAIADDIEELNYLVPMVIGAVEQARAIFYGNTRSREIPQDECMTGVLSRTFLRAWRVRETTDTIFNTLTQRPAEGFAKTIAQQIPLALESSAGAIVGFANEFEHIIGELMDCQSQLPWADIFLTYLEREATELQTAFEQFKQWVSDTRQTLCQPSSPVPQSSPSDLAVIGTPPDPHRPPPARKQPTQQKPQLACQA